MVVLVHHEHTLHVASRGTATVTRQPFAFGEFFQQRHVIVVVLFKLVFFSKVSRQSRLVVQQFGVVVIVPAQLFVFQIDLKGRGKGPKVTDRFGQDNARVIVPFLVFEVANALGEGAAQMSRQRPTALTGRRLGSIVAAKENVQ